MKPLYNDTREVLMRNGHTRALLILDGLYANNVNPLEGLSAYDVQALLPNTSEFIIRSGLADQHIFKQEKRSTGKRGRPTILYIVPDRDTLRDQYVPVSERVFDFADTLPYWAYHNQREYRLAYLQTMILRRQEMYVNKNQDWDGFTCPMMYMADMLGVTRGTVRAYKRVLGVHSAEQFLPERVTTKTLNKIPEQGKPGREYLAHGNPFDITAGKGSKAPLMREIAERWLACGLVVWRVVQLASKIQIPWNVALYCGNGEYTGNWTKVINPQFGVERVAA